MPNSTHARVAMGFTMLNLICGFLSLISTLNGRYYEAAGLILLAAVFDSVDGRIARRGNCSTDLGKELDSLCDMVSFGTAPALLMLTKVIPENVYAVILAAAIFYVVCGAYRLARFNVMNNPEYFTGVPITLAGMAVALISFWGGSQSAGLVIPLLLVLGFLMVSGIKVPKPLSKARGANN